MFKSGLEEKVSDLLCELGVDYEYEGTSFSYTIAHKYTPDFVSRSFIIECKGRANESFPMRWKLFKKYVKANMPRVTLYKPQNQKECDTVIELITKSKIK